MNRYEVTLTQKVYREVEITKTFEVDAENEYKAERDALNSWDYTDNNVTLTDEENTFKDEEDDVQTEGVYLLEEDIEEDED